MKNKFQARHDRPGQRGCPRFSSGGRELDLPRLSVPQDWGPLACSGPQCEQKVEYPKHERGVVLPSLQVPKYKDLVMLVVSTKVEYPKDFLQCKAGGGVSKRWSTVSQRLSSVGRGEGTASHQEVREHLHHQRLALPGLAKPRPGGVIRPCQRARNPGRPRPCPCAFGPKTHKKWTRSGNNLH